MNVAESLSPLWGRPLLCWWGVTGIYLCLGKLERKLFNLAFRKPRGPLAAPAPRPPSAPRVPLLSHRVPRVGRSHLASRNRDAAQPNHEPPLPQSPPPARAAQGWAEGLCSRCVPSRPVPSEGPSSSLPHGAPGHCGLQGGYRRGRWEWPPRCHHQRLWADPRPWVRPEAQPGPDGFLLPPGIALSWVMRSDSPEPS